MAEAPVKSNRCLSMAHTESLYLSTSIQRTASEGSGGDRDKADVNA